jgi:hypothetical protein
MGNPRSAVRPGADRSSYPFEDAKGALVKTQEMAKNSFGLELPAATAPLCEVKPGSIAAKGRLEGLECRWQDIPSRHGETVSAMVRALNPDPGEAAKLFVV